jgi:hypothetical protein
MGSSMGRALALAVAVSAAAVLAPAPALAFHSGGVGDCDGCHSMHNSLVNAPNVRGRAFIEGTGPYLLKANDQSGSCLNCHESGDPTSSYHVATAGVAPYDSTTPLQLTPGGDFAWLKKTMNLVIRGTAIADGNPGERHGHNIVAVDFGYVQDTTHVISPGDAYPAESLGCHSCHDPHGTYRRFADGTIARTGLPSFGSGSYTDSLDPIPGVSAVGVYRHLAGRGYQPKSLTGSHAFANDPPAAVVSPDYNRSEASRQTGIAYGRGMSEWCANCHPNLLQASYTSGMAGLRHPVGNGAKLTDEIAAGYLAYVSSGVMTNADPSRAFSTLAPVELGTADYAALKAQAMDHDPPTTEANVMCLSCHRSHASGFPSKLRFFYLNEFLTVGDDAGVAAYDSSTTENKINYGYDVIQQQAAYGGRPATAFGPYARSYCNKCHAKD